MTADDHYYAACNLLGQAKMLRPTKRPNDGGPGRFVETEYGLGGRYGLDAPDDADRLIAAAHVHALLAHGLIS